MPSILFISTRLSPPPPKSSINQGSLSSLATRWSGNVASRSCSKPPAGVQFPLFISSYVCRNLGHRAQMYAHMPSVWCVCLNVSVLCVVCEHPTFHPSILLLSPHVMASHRDGVVRCGVDGKKSGGPSSAKVSSVSKIALLSAIPQSRPCPCCARYPPRMGVPVIPFCHRQAPWSVSNERDVVLCRQRKRWVSSDMSWCVAPGLRAGRFLPAQGSQRA